MTKGKTAKRPYSPPTSWDSGASGPANRERLHEERATDFNTRTQREDPNPNAVKRHRRRTWAAVYHAQGKLTHAHVAAAEKLRMAAEGMREKDPLAQIRIDRTPGGDLQAARIDARRWFHVLWKDVPSGCRAIVERVVIDDLPIWHGNQEHRERQMERLRIGLDAIS